MGTAGARLLGPDGKRLLATDGKVKLSNGGDNQCCCGADDLWEPADYDCGRCTAGTVPKTITVSIAGATLCTCTCVQDCTGTITYPWVRYTGFDINGTYVLTQVPPVSPATTSCTWRVPINQTITDAYFAVAAGGCNGSPAITSSITALFLQCTLTPLNTIRVVLVTDSTAGGGVYFPRFHADAAHSVGPCHPSTLSFPQTEDAGGSCRYDRMFSGGTIIVTF